MRNTVECSKCKNDKCFIKQFCSCECIGKISIGKNQNVYKKGEYIFREGSPIFGFYFILEGGVKIVSSILNNRKQIVRLAKDGDILGLRGIGLTEYYFNAIALMDTTVCFVETEQFYNACKQSPDLAYNLMFFFSHELKLTELRVKYQAQMNIREKVAHAFLYYIEMFGVNPKTKTLNIETNRQDIADLAGTTAEQVTRQLNDFEGEHLVSRQKRDIRILNIDGLENIIADYKIE